MECRRGGRVTTLRSSPQGGGATLLREAHCGCLRPLLSQRPPPPFIAPPSQLRPAPLLPSAPLATRPPRLPSILNIHKCNIHLLL